MKIIGYGTLIVINYYFWSKLESLFNIVDDISFIGRQNTFYAALDLVSGNLLLGLGKDSFQGYSYKYLVGGYFYSSDIGLVGLIVPFGLLGIILYSYGSVWLMSNMVSIYKRHSIENNLINKELLFVWMVLSFVAIISTPTLTWYMYNEGPLVAGIGWGFVMYLAHFKAINQPAAERQAVPNSENRAVYSR